jgi:hypothetical protein
VRVGCTAQPAAHRGRRPAEPGGDRAEARAARLRGQRVADHLGAVGAPHSERGGQQDLGAQAISAASPAVGSRSPCRRPHPARCGCGRAGTAQPAWAARATHHARLQDPLGPRGARHHDHRGRLRSSRRTLAYHTPNREGAGSCCPSATPTSSRRGADEPDLPQRVDVERGAHRLSWKQPTGLHGDGAEQPPGSTCDIGSGNDGRLRNGRHPQRRSTCARPGHRSEGSVLTKRAIYTRSALQPAPQAVRDGAGVPSAAVRTLQSERLC